jgi:hypothetical protein
MEGSFQALPSPNTIGWPNTLMTVQAEIIYQPTSGQYREKIFDTTIQNFTIRAWSWVLFTKLNGSEWVGHFMEVRAANGLPRYAQVRLQLLLSRMGKATLSM